MVLNLFHRQVVACFEGAYACFGDLGDLLVCQVVKVFHVKDQPLFVWQSQQSLLQFQLNVVAGYLLSAGKFLHELMLKVTEPEKIASFLALQEVQALVRGDAIDPGVELRVVSESMNILMDFDKNLLGQVVSVVVTDYHFADQPIHPLLVLSHQQIESVILCFRITKFFQDILIFQPAGFDLR